MKLFNRFKNKIYEEAPLTYWEEKSYMKIIPDNNDKSWTEGITERISKIPNVSVTDDNFDAKTGILSVNLIYDNDKYELGFYLGMLKIPDFYFDKSFYFSKDEKDKLNNAKLSLTFYMNFSSDIKKSYHLQLKIALAAIPNLIGLLDESAERILPVKWVKLAAQSKIPPGPTNIYNLQIIYDDNKCYWLHTHGLCRCGLTELEIVDSNQNNFEGHANIIDALASYMIDKKGDFDPRKKSVIIGQLENNIPIIITCKSWIEGLKYYKKLDLGGILDRENSHNTKTSLIFLYKDLNDENNNVISKVNIYDNLWQNDPIFFFSQEETERMKALAIERFSYVKEAFKNKKNKILIKIGLSTENNDYEYLWFKLVSFSKQGFNAKLTQKPYNVKNINVNDVKEFKVADVVDWLICTKDKKINPNNIYLL